MAVDDKLRVPGTGINRAVLHGIDGDYLYEGKVDTDGHQYSKMYVKNADTLAWEPMTNMTVTVGELTVSGVAVSNLPSTFSYKLSDMAADSDPSYFGYVDQYGAWYIMKLTDSTGQARYAKGASAYAVAWGNKEGQDYGYFNDKF